MVMSSFGEVNPRAVLVVYGRNLAARRAVFDFLRVIDLRPLEWDVLAGQTRSGSPFVLEILEHAFEIAQAIVVILTPDEKAILNPALLYRARRRQTAPPASTQRPIRSWHGVHA